jgi:hypothetical protein
MILLALDREQHLPVFVQYAFDDVGGELVDGKCRRVDLLGRSDCHFNGQACDQDLRNKSRILS